ncbi:MAG: hypothetical protein RLZZ410_408 [Pseudomonadota bacterium]|jgi:hypothetical protein
MSYTEAEQLLANWLAGHAESKALIKEFRGLAAAYQLPEKYLIALESVISRIESSSLFTEESCSFSKKDLAHALEFWLEKARQYHLKESS